MLREEPVAVCPQCESSVRREARFCDQCGWSLSSEERITEHSAGGLEVLFPDETIDETVDETVGPESGPGVEGDTEARFEPVGASEGYREPQRKRATLQEKIGGGLRTLVLWSGSPLLLLVVLAGAVARDNFRRVDSQVPPMLQGESGQPIPDGVPGMALPLEIVIPFTGEEKITDFETVNDGFTRPRGVTLSNGSIYVVDPGQRALVVLDGEGRPIAQVERSDRPFVEPVDVAVDGAGNVYVLDAGDGGQVSMHGPDGEFQRVVPIPEQAADRSRGLDVDGQGRIWLAMTPALAVVAFDSLGQELVRISTDFEGTDLQPVDVAYRSDGSVFVSTAGMTSVLRFTEAGELLNLWPLVVANSMDGPHLALDSEGTVYVTQPEQGGVLRIAGDNVEDLAAWVLAGGQPLRKLVGIAAGDPGVLVVTDSDNGNIYRIEISP